MSVPAPIWGSSSPVCRHPLKLRRAVPAGLHEIKHDGFRILAHRDSAGVRLITRAGNEFSHRFPFIAMAVGKLPVRSCLIDGEAIVCDENGLAVFELIRRHGALASAVLCAFDLLELDGRDLRRELIEKRKGLLAKLLRGNKGASSSTSITKRTARLYSARRASSDARGSSRNGSAQCIVEAGRHIG